MLIYRHDKCILTKCVFCKNVFFICRLITSAMCRTLLNAECARVGGGKMLIIKLLGLTTAVFCKCFCMIVFISVEECTATFDCKNITFY